MSYVEVNGNTPQDFQKALQIFVKKVKKSGVLEEVRRREHYMKPSIKRKFKRNEALKQRKRDARLLARKNNNNG